MVKKYVAITVSSKEELNDLQLGKGTFFNSFTNSLDKAFDYEINTEGKINLNLRENSLPIYASLAEVQSNTDHNQVIVEFDDESKKVAAIHDTYFTQADGQYYRA